MQETQFRFLGQEDPLEKETVTHSSMLAWKIPWTEEPGSPWGCKQSDMIEHMHTHIRMCNFNSERGLNETFI